MKLGGSLRSQKISKNRKNPAVLNLKSRLIGLEMCRVYMTDVNGLQEDVECQYIYIYVNIIQYLLSTHGHWDDVQPFAWLGLKTEELNLSMADPN